MPTSNLNQGLSPWGDQNGVHSPPKKQAPSAAHSPAPPNLAPQTQNPEPTPPVIISDILPSSTPGFVSPRPGGNGHPGPGGLGQRALDSPRRRAESPQLFSSASTPRSSRIEVVLKPSPFKKLSGHQVFNEADLEDDELAAANLTPPKRPRAPQVSSISRHVIPAVKASAPSTIKRPRGRPKGWRPGMPSTKTGLPTASAAKYLDANGNPVRDQKPVHAPTSTGQKRRGRPPRPPPPTAREVWESMAPPKYLPFQCEWANCHAELQNFRTLRKHIQVVHGNFAPRVCRWAKCGKADQPPVFAQDSDFHNHLDTAHLMPYVWHCGEGHNNNRCVTKRKLAQGQDEMPDYLFGPDGVQVTPSVRGQVVESALTYQENRRRLKKILFQRDANAPSEEEDETGELNPPQELSPH